MPYLWEDKIRPMFYNYHRATLKEPKSKITHLRGILIKKINKIKIEQSR